MGLAKGIAEAMKSLKVLVLPLRRYRYDRG